MITIYHNPRCGKSRAALQALKDRGLDYNVRLYLENPPTQGELTDILKKSRLRPLDIIRTKEQVFQSEFKNKTLSDEAWIEAIIKYPILLERPIFIDDHKAAVVRSDEAIQAFLQ
ncbi:MAG: arsenate reductase (glutaredoxin) [Saprospiraceae bacterium]|nr:arsenate reductase (glutaredoxin) [Saprospiraceae bacterium]